jgi:hypothetical protein
MDQIVWIAIGALTATLALGVNALVIASAQAHRQRRARAAPRQDWTEGRYQGHLCARCLDLVPEGPTEDDSQPTYCKRCAPHEPVAS